ncbi:MAG: helix-turn-helix domain-containing protein, partial [Blastococcus sp.]
MSAITVGQAAKVAGVPVEVLRELCDARKVPALKGKRGHWYLNAEDIPTRDWVLEAVREQYREDVAGAQEA